MSGFLMLDFSLLPRLTFHVPNIIRPLFGDYLLCIRIYIITLQGFMSIVFDLLNNVFP